MIRPQISKAACQDLDVIAEYFLTRNIDAGERFFQEFNQKCKYLVNFPFIGKSYPSISNGLRGLPILTHHPFSRLLISRIVNIETNHPYPFRRRFFKNPIDQPIFRIIKGNL